MFTIRYLQSLHRHSQIRRENAEIAAQPGPSLLSLPDDLLFIILDILQGGDRDPWAVWHSLEHYRGDFVRLSMTCRRLRLLALPQLFRTVRLGPSWSVDKMKQVLDGIERHTDLQGLFSKTAPCKATVVSTAQLKHTLNVRPPPTSITAQIRALKIHHWSGSPNRQSMSVARQLVAWIQTLPNLNSLWISTSVTLAMPLRSAFQNKSVSFPNITELKVCASTEWIGSHCPNLRVLDTKDWVLWGYPRDIREFSCNSENLQHLTMHCSLYEAMSEHLITYVPHLKALSITSRHPNCSLSQMLKRLARLRELERLDLVSTRLMESPPITWEMAPSHDASIRKRLLESDQGITPAQESITGMVFKALPHLKKLTLGEKFKAESVREGKVVMQCHADPHIQPAIMTRDIFLDNSTLCEWEEIGYDEAMR